MDEDGGVEIKKLWQIENVKVDISEKHQCLIASEDDIREMVSSWPFESLSFLCLFMPILNYTY